MAIKKNKFIEVPKGTGNTLINIELIERVESYSTNQAKIYIGNACVLVDISYDELVRLITTGNTKETLNG